MQLILGDITKLPTDAIIVPCASDLKMIDGISHGVFQAADTEMLKAALKKIGHCPIGHAVVTPAFGLPSRYIVHVAGAGFYSGRMNEQLLFQDCYRHALQKAYAYQAKSVALPLMFSGSFHLPRGEALSTVFDVVEAFEPAHPGMEIFLVLYKESIYTLAEDLLRKRRGEKTKKRT